MYDTVKNETLNISLSVIPSIIKNADSLCSPIPKLKSRSITSEYLIVCSINSDSDAIFTLFMPKSADFITFSTPVSNMHIGISQRASAVLMSQSTSAAICSRSASTPSASGSSSDISTHSANLTTESTPATPRFTYTRARSHPCLPPLQAGRALFCTQSPSAAAPYSMPTA